MELPIEVKRRKQNKFDNFIASIYKLPSLKYRKLACYQGNAFINLYKTFFDKHYVRWMEDLLPLSISGTLENASTFSWWYLGVTDPDKTEINIGEFEVHNYNVSTTIWRNYLDSLTINTKDFDGDTIVSHKSTM